MGPVSGPLSPSVPLSFLTGCLKQTGWLPRLSRAPRWVTLGCHTRRLRLLTLLRLGLPVFFQVVLLPFHWWRRRWRKLLLRSAWPLGFLSRGRPSRTAVASATQAASEVSQRPDVTGRMHLGYAKQKQAQCPTVPKPNRQGTKCQSQT